MDIQTKVKFVSLNKVTVETPQGDRFTVGLNRVVPVPLQEQDAQVIAYLFDKYYKGDPDVIMGPIYREMLRCGCWSAPYWYGPDRDNERERIGAQIRSLREERRLEIKDLAGYADIDPSNLSRIERGKFSPALDILCKIAAAMDCSVEIIPIGAQFNNYRVNMAGRAIPDEHASHLISISISAFHLADCLAKYGEFHWQQQGDTISIGDIVYIYIPEEHIIKYKMTVEQVDEQYSRQTAQEEEFWVDKGRLTDESHTKYALLRLVKESRSGRLTEESIVKRGFISDINGAKLLEGELLRFIQRKF
jgi:transcriptional regulator with XRE-family HTH domain